MMRQSQTLNYKALLKGKEFIRSTLGSNKQKRKKMTTTKVSTAYRVHTNASKKSSASKLREQRDVLKKIGEKIDDHGCRT